MCVCVCVCVLLCCSPLDELIDLLGGVERVAEMTGRQARIVRRASGRLVYEVRDARGSGATLESINNLEVNKGDVKGTMDSGFQLHVQYTLVHSTLQCSLGVFSI